MSAAITTKDRWSLIDYVAAAAMFAVGLFTNIVTVLNNAYNEGSTLYDSTIFQTIIWRSGWSLKPAPAVDDISFLNTHFSPINYIPDLLSYIAPVDRMTWYGMVYGAVYGGILVLAFAALRRLYPALIAVVGALLLYLSGEILNAQWEPHQEIASALLTMGFFLAWTSGRPRLTLLCLVLNVMVREDCGALLALPLLLLAAHAWWAQRRTGRRADDAGSASSFRVLPLPTLGYAVLSMLLSATAFTIKKHYFSGHDVVAAFYYGNAFNHLTMDLLHQRALYYLQHAQYLWMPGVALLLSAALLRDSRLAIAWVAYFPYWLFSFLSQGELNADMGSYKAFPLVLALVWPALLIRLPGAPRKRSLAIVQAAVLLAGCVSYENGALRIAAPFDLDGLSYRWLPQPGVQQAAAYRDFETQLANVGDLGTVRASQAVLALYPYNFPRWDRSSLTDEGVAGAGDLDSLIWFEGDRDAERVAGILAIAQFPYQYRVDGTKLHVATKFPPAQLHAFKFASQAAEPPAPETAPLKPAILRGDNAAGG